MQGERRNAKLLTVSDVREFFREALHLALGHQHLKVRDHTEQYVVNLLAMFARTDAPSVSTATRASSHGVSAGPWTALASASAIARSTASRASPASPGNATVNSGEAS